LQAKDRIHSQVEDSLASLASLTQAGALAGI